MDAVPGPHGEPDSDPVEQALGDLRMAYWRVRAAYFSSLGDSAAAEAAANAAAERLVTKPVKRRPFAEQLGTVVDNPVCKGRFVRVEEPPPLREGRELLDLVDALDAVEPTISHSAHVERVARMLIDGCDVADPDLYRRSVIRRIWRWLKKRSGDSIQTRGLPSMVMPCALRLAGNPTVCWNQ